MVPYLNVARDLESVSFDSLSLSVVYILYGVILLKGLHRSPVLAQYWTSLEICNPHLSLRCKNMGTSGPG